MNRNLSADASGADCSSTRASYQCQCNPFLTATPATTPPPTKRGRIRLVGSGPGDPNLLTLAAYKAIQEADLVVADKLVSAEVLELIPQHVEVVVANKVRGNQEVAQEEIYRIAEESLSEGRDVVRLKQGDPYVFGRGGEEYLYFQKLGYTPEVIPGISSSMAAPLFADIPVTHRGVASQLLICTGTGKKNTKPDIPPYSPIRTTVILMGVHRIRQLMNELMELGGYPDDCPCAVVERASSPDQRVVHGTVGTIAGIMEQVGSMPPGTLIIGRTCDVLRGSHAGDISLGRLCADQGLEVMER